MPRLTLKTATLISAVVFSSVWSAAAFAQCQDQWVSQAVREVAGRAARGQGATGECDVRNYGTGQWSSYGDLKNKVRLKLTNVGTAYIFVKPQNVANLGHIGWGVQLQDGRYFAGSTENYGAKPYIGKGDKNGYWAREFATEADMQKYFKQLGYYAYKTAAAARPQFAAAIDKAEFTRVNGFMGVGWNCLDHTYAILEAYGLKDMPWKQTHPAPNHWFNDFGGNGTSGYKLP